MNVDEERLKRARRVARSALISRFGAPKSSSHHHAPITQRPPQSPPAEPRPVLSTPIPTKQPSSDIFERALERANSHQQPAFTHKKTHRKKRLGYVGRLAASSLAVMLIIGFVAYQNVANIQMHIAASRAGINASLPHWQPGGFSIGKLSYKSGMVTVSFENTATKRTFDLVQTASHWDTTALLNNYVYPNNNTYNTVQSAGMTIYTYGSNNATWVNGGIWYKLVTDGTLSTSQVVNIATSM